MLVDILYRNEEQSSRLHSIYPNSPIHRPTAQGLHFVPKLDGLNEVTNRPYYDSIYLFVAMVGSTSMDNLHQGLHINMHTL